MGEIPSLPVLAMLALLTAGLGSLGGLGGAVFLVPILVLLGVDPKIAAPLGIMSVAAGSLAAAPRQLASGVVHHRLGVTLEIAASAGAIVGALMGDAVSADMLRWILVVVALAAAVSGLRQRGLRNLPSSAFVGERAGEWPGTLGGTYHLGDEVVPYQAVHIPGGLVAMVVAGLVSGLAGVGGGFVKTPAMTDLMRIPVRVAAATTTFTVGVTAAATILVFSGQHRIDWIPAAAVVLGGLAGGVIGAETQQRLHPAHTRVVLSVALLVVAVILAVTA